MTLAKYIPVKSDEKILNYSFSSNGSDYVKVTVMKEKKIVKTTSRKTGGGYTWILGWKWDFYDWIEYTDKTYRRTWKELYGVYTNNGFSEFLGVIPGTEEDEFISSDTYTRKRYR